MISFDQVRLLQKETIHPGDRWIYVTDANIKVKDGKLKNTDRLDVELDDIAHIADQGGIVLILAHKGRFKDGDADSLKPHADYFSLKLKRPVPYFEYNTGEVAITFAKGLAPGSIAVMGNTRGHIGEEKNDLALAKEFSMLGSYIAVGGFGKAHRKDASNYGLLDYLPGSLADSQVKEMVLLGPWAGKENKYSVVVLGGVKKEKITTGLLGFAKTYDSIIPGGIVLNTVLKAKGYDVGDSLLDDEGKTFEKETLEILNSQEGSKICIPDEVIIAKKEGFIDAKRINIQDGVPKGYMIVDYVLPSSGKESLDRVVLEHGRMIVAGTPGIYQSGFRIATDEVMNAMNNSAVQAIVLGGDTAAEVAFNGKVSTGGGSALYFVANGTTPVFEKLKENKKKFP